MWRASTVPNKTLVTPYHPGMDWGNTQTFPCSTATERVCVKSDYTAAEFNCIAAFPFCGYYHATNDSWTNIMGMWYGNKSGGTYTELLRASGYINETIFGMVIDHNLTDGPHFSYVEFGIFNSASMRNINDITWISNTAGEYWGNSITGFKFGASSNQPSFS